MTATKLGQPHGKLTVADHVSVEDLHVTGAVHGLETKGSLLVGDHVHIVLELVPVTALLPEAAVVELWRLDFLVAVSFQLATNIVLDDAEELVATRVPEYAACGIVLKME
jgi:hypothetical protein